MICYCLERQSNSYLLHHIIDSFPRIVKLNCKFNFIFFTRRARRFEALIILLFLFYFSWKIVCKTIQYRISLCPRTGSDPGNIYRFINPTGILFYLLTKIIDLCLYYQQPTQVYIIWNIQKGKSFFKRGFPTYVFVRTFDVQPHFGIKTQYNPLNFKLFFI